MRGLALAIALVSRWVCAAMACANARGKSKHNLLKNAITHNDPCFMAAAVFEAASCLRDQTLNEDKTYSLHSTPALRKHFVVPRARPVLFFCPSGISFYSMTSIRIQKYHDFCDVHTFVRMH